MSYQDEYEALWEWFDAKTKEYFDASDKEINSGKKIGFDSVLDIVRRQDVKQYNRRLLSLKEKYGVASAEELKMLEGYRANTDYNEEMDALCGWLKRKILEREDFSDIYQHEYREFDQRYGELKEKYLAKK